jgi:hypothetical protein
VEVEMHIAPGLLKTVLVSLRDLNENLSLSRKVQVRDR